MAGFGGAVKLTGESEYRKALNSINNSLKETSAELKLVSVQYANNDKDIFALTQKQAALNKQLDAQAQKEKTLRDQYAAMSAQYAENKTKHEALVKSLESETSKLKEIESTCGKASSEYKAQAQVVSNLTTDVNKSSNALDQNETALSKVKVALTNASTEMRKTEQSLDSVDKQIDEVKNDSGDMAEEVKKAGEEADKAGKGGFTVFKGVLADLTSSAIKSAISGLADLGRAAISLGKDAITSYADYEQLVGGVETLFGAGGQSLEEYAKSVGMSVDEARGRYNDLMVAQDYVLKDAADAYKTAGMSANEYMETVTSFSASLISSLDGDTVAAAEAANRAITDMSDNANKMGTDLASIQNAYQGFAKQNYTMLDNLKLGYGGTKEEMQRLLEDAEKISGVKYDMSNLNDVYEAIHVVQTEMGITGTTAKEAASTIAGSTGMMKSAWSNLLTGIADDNANFDELITNFIDSVMTVADNLIPRIQTTIEGMAKLAAQLLQRLVPQLVQMIPPLLTKTVPLLLNAVQSVLQSILKVLPQILPVISQLISQMLKMIISSLPDFISAGIDILLSLIDGISDAIPDLIEMLPTIIETIINTLLDKLPQIIETGIGLLQGIVDGLLKAIPTLIQMLPTIINTIVKVLIDNLPTIINSGVDILFALIDGLIQALPELVEMVPTIVYKITQTLAENWDKIKDSGKKIIEKILTGLEEKIGNLLLKVKEIGNKVVEKVKEIPDRVKKYGKRMVEGIWEGISGAAGWLGNKIKEFCDGVVNKVKNFFSIFSPSRLMRDEVGKYLAMGIGVGFTDEMENVAEDMTNSIPSSFDIEPTINAEDTINGLGGLTYSYTDLVNAFKEALTGVDVELDDQKVGRFVKKTVTDAIYN